MATRLAPRLAATADALPPPGTGSAEASAAMKPSSVRSRKRVGVVGSTTRIVRLRLGCASDPVHTRQSGAMDQGAETSDRFEISYTVTADAMLDASRLYRASFLRIVTAIVAILAIVGVALVIIGEPGVGAWM